MAQANEVVIIDAKGAEHVFPAGFDPAQAARIVKERAGSTARTAVEQLADWIPTVAGGVGAVAGGLPGTMVGGAAGQGYRQLATKGAELPGAALDTMKNLWAQPKATIGGAVEGGLEGAKDAGIEGALQALYELGGRFVTGALSAGGRAVYRGYLKPSLSARLLPKANQIVETGIREAIPVSEAGSARVEALIGELNGEVERILQGTSGDVNLQTVANQVRSFAKRRYFRPGKPTADFEAAMRVADELDKHPSMPANPFWPKQPPKATPSAANRIKGGLDDTIGESNFGVDRGATKTAQKVARNRMRTAIEGLAPDVGALNARQGRLIDLGRALNSAVGREGNRNQLFGVPSVLSGMTGGAELVRGANPYTAAVMSIATRVGLTPQVASRAAILAARMGDKVPGTAAADIARAAVRVVSEAGQEPDE